MVAVRATAVGWDMKQNAVLAGDPKALVYYVISKLNKDISSRIIQRGKDKDKDPPACMG